MADIKKKEEAIFKEEFSSDESSGTEDGNNKITVFDKKKNDSSSNLSVTSSTYGSTELKQGVKGYDPTLEWEAHEETKVRRKIDMYLMPFIMLMAFVLNMDRTNHSNAISDHLAQDLGFTNDGVNNGILAYSILFTIFTLPSNFVSKKIGAYRWLPIMMSAWNYAGYMTVRVLIAVTEAGFIPATLNYLTQWYKTKELATRLAFFWGIQSIASAVSGLISFGIFRLRGVGGLEGWKWLFLIDGIFTHVVAIIAFFYLPKDPGSTNGSIRGKSGWFTERETKIAVTRVIRDDLTKTDQDVPITWVDVKDALTDPRLWMHLTTTFVGMMTNTPIRTYLPSIIRDGGFAVTTANLLTMPSYLGGLVFSLLIAHLSDKYGEVALFAIIGNVWEMVGYITLKTLPGDTGRWPLFAAATVTASAPSWHGMHIAYMSSNMAPAGKRALALGAIIGAANLDGVPGSQIYRASDAPRYPTGNTVCIILNIAAFGLFITQRVSYSISNKRREKKWNALSDTEKEEYNNTTKDRGNRRLDYRFRI
ncbi:major facilitator superfamily domain-containing protein [Phascolomyces articulosus]|uniref:Major facilitator superfamily domain-containing protein n=1 Tax=Phascolomyces articulosus TaxID=60185 RepID=A0AAD5PHZ1_9FUNG|nr:major facilitator superfamily domain-containing protein [Phascolomyces articulosus]